MQMNVQFSEQDHICGALVLLASLTLHPICMGRKKLQLKLARDACPCTPYAIPPPRCNCAKLPLASKVATGICAWFHMAYL